MCVCVHPRSCMLKASARALRPVRGWPALPGQQMHASWQAVTDSAAVDLSSFTSVVHVCTLAASSAATIGVHSGLLSATLELAPAVLIDCEMSSAAALADVSDVQAAVTLPSESKAAEICLADALSGVSLLEKDESDACGASSQAGLSEGGQV